MMDLSPTVFGAAGLLYAVLIPIVFVQLMALAFIPSILNNGAKALHVGKALFCYTMQGVGIVLMTISGLPAVYSVLVGLPMTGNMYLALILIFAIGGFVYLWHEHRVSFIDDASRAVPYALYFYTVKFAGAVVVLGSLLSLSLTMLMTSSTIPPAVGWWITPLLFLLYGLLLSLCTKWPRMHSASFQMNNMKKPPMPAVKPPVMVAQKQQPMPPRPPRPPMNAKQAQAMQARKK